MAVSWERMAQIVRSARTIAVVGLSDKPDRPSNEIARYLQRRATESFGEPAPHGGARRTSVSEPAGNL